MKNGRHHSFMKSITAWTLVCCMLLGITGTALAGSLVGSSPDYVVPSAVKSFVKLSKNVTFFTGATYLTGTTVSVPVGQVCQLVSADFYSGTDGQLYYSVYYNNQRYNALMTDLQSDIMTDAQLSSYVTDVLWRQSSYTSLKKELNLVGDVRVYGLQVALQKLGYYSDKLDGNFGDNTANAVKAFQKANGLSADGAAGVLTQPVLYAKALSASGYNNNSNNNSNNSSSQSSGKLKTTASVNLRQSYTKSSPRLAIVPRNVTLPYTATRTQSDATWYRVNYNNLNGWLMGTFVSATGSSSSSSSSSSAVAIGTITITKPATRVRTAPNGSKSGTVLAKGSQVEQLSDMVSAAGYGWYKIRTASGLIGYVRNDCAQVNGSNNNNNNNNNNNSNPIVVSDTSFIRLSKTVTLFQTETKPTSGGLNAPAGSILRLYDGTTYSSGGNTYCSVYYNSVKYNCVYSDVSGDLMTATALSDYVKSLWSSSLSTSLKRNMNLTGDIRVYALQVALNSLGLYTGKLDGTYGSDTETAVRNFQRQNKITIDGMCGKVTWSTLCAKVSGSNNNNNNNNNKNNNGVVVPDFGTVKQVVKASWNYDDNGASLFPKGSYATIMDVDTGKVFRVYRWSGGSHADCVPASTNDTKIMCDIVGYPYNSNHPTASQLEKIKADGSKSTVTYTWPDFKNAFGGSKNIGSAWDRRSCLVNVNGTVYPVSIYGFPHGFDGKDSFSNSKFPDGSYFYNTNNFYGMICIHFTGSKTHSGTTPDSAHQSNITKAYQYAQQLWPSLCK